MPILVPSASLSAILTRILTEDCILKLFSNDHTPALGDTVASLTEVTGGGYVAITLEFANWDIAEGDPDTVALYNALQDFNFTGATGGSGDIYGYYIVDAATELDLMWEQRFSTTPFTPQNGALIRIRPRFTDRNQS